MSDFWRMAVQNCMFVFDVLVVYLFLAALIDWFFKRFFLHVSAVFGAASHSYWKNYFAEKGKFFKELGEDVAGELQRTEGGKDRLH